MVMVGACRFEPTSVSGVSRLAVDRFAKRGCVAADVCFALCRSPVGVSGFWPSRRVKVDEKKGRPLWIATVLFAELIH